MSSSLACLGGVSSYAEVGGDKLLILLAIASMGGSGDCKDDALLYVYDDYLPSVARFARLDVDTTRRLLDELERDGHVLQVEPPESSPGAICFFFPQVRLLQAATPTEARPPAPPRYVKQPIPPVLRAQVLKRDGYRCRWCRIDSDLRVDHIHPESKGGPPTLENLQTLCAPCNSSKGARTR